MGLLFFLVAAGAFPSITVSFGSGGKVMVNSPYTLAALISSVSSSPCRHRRAGGPGGPPGLRPRHLPAAVHRPAVEGRYLGGRFLGALGC